MNELVELNSHNVVPRKGISWRAIFAGVACILSVVFLLNLLGLVFGFGTINPVEENNPLSGVGTGSLIWWIVSNLIALFAGGYVAARVGVSFYHKSGIVQGIMTWALYTFISAWLLTSAVGSIISGVGNTIGSVLSSGSDQQEQSQREQQLKQQQNQQLNISFEQAKREFYNLLEDTEKDALDPDRLENQAQEVVQNAKQEAREAVRKPGQIDAQVEQIFDNARNEFEDSWKAIDKEALVNVLTERTDMSETEARNTVERYVSQYENLRQESEQIMEQVKQKAQETAGNIAEAISDAALYLFIALLLGVIVAAAGGAVGVKSLRSDYVDSHYIHSEYRTYRDDDVRGRSEGVNDSDDRRI